MIRLIPQPGEPIDAAELNGMDDLIQARIDRRISRRDLVRRAMEIGIAAPVVGVMLHATSDMAFGAPNNRGANALARQQDGQTVQVTGPTQPSGTMQEGGTVVVGTAEEPDYIHPYLSTTVTGFDVAVGIIETLLEYDGNQQLQPQLVTEYTISENGLTYTLKLRPGVTFHSGDPLTGQDVIDSWKMIMDPNFGASNTLGWDKITDITLADDNMTVVMTTSEVYAPFLSYVGAGNNGIAPSKELAKGVDEFKQKFGRDYMVGTGPMKFVEWEAKEQITLERYDNYWGGKPHLEKVIYRIVPDTNTELVQIQTGEIQLVGSAGALGALDVDKALEYDNVIVMEHATLGWTHLDLKHIDFLRMTKVRQALDYATPKQQIIEQLLKNRALPSVADQAPGSWAFNPDIQPRPYDLDMAKQLLTEAGLTQDGDGVWSGPVPAGTPRADGGEYDPNAGDPNVVPATGPVKELAIEIWGLAGDEQNNRICQVIAQSWSQIGIKTETKFGDTSTIWGPTGYQFTDKMTAANWAWFNANDPVDEYYWHSSQVPKTPTGTGGNLPAYYFPYNFQAQIDDLTARAARETDQEARKQLYFQIQQLLFDEVPVIWLYWGKAFPVVATNIGGYWPSAFTNLLWNVEQWYLTQ